MSLFDFRDIYTKTFSDVTEPLNRRFNFVINWGDVDFGAGDTIYFWNPINRSRILRVIYFVEQEPSSTLRVDIGDVDEQDRFYNNINVSVENGGAFTPYSSQRPIGVGDRQLTVTHRSGSATNGSLKIWLDVWNHSFISTFRP